MLELENISFSYDREITISGVSFSVAQGENLAVIGESGCGKSTLLKLIYGLYDLDEGSIYYNDEAILGPKFNLIPGMDFIKYLAQDFDLMPFITVEENVGKFLSNIDKEKKSARISELLEMVEMTEFAKTKAKNLSGGQQQRVAIAKALAVEPEILLLDEPFSQIDAFRRNNLRRNLFKYLKQKQITCIIATHDSTDILGFADEIVVLKDGKILRKDRSKRIYEHPENFYTASLFGEVNEIPEYLIGHSQDKMATTFVYPHQLEIVPKSNLQVTVVQSVFKGNGYLVECVSESQTIFFESTNLIMAGTEVFIARRSMPTPTY